MSEDLTQWEYKKVGFKDVLNEEVLNKLGSEGWEMAGSFPSSMGAGQAIMKRPKQKSNDYGYSR